MNVYFYFDPSCPFCWITSRWLEMVQPQRDMTVTWQPFSLAIKNDELAGEDHTPHAAGHRAAHRVLRVMQAANAEHNADVGKMYTVFGRMYHVTGREYSDEMIADALSELHLPAELLEAVDDTSFDAALGESIATATDVLGNDIGVPTIMVETADGTKQGYFGPVLNALPDEEEALKLWDGLSTLMQTSDFYELKCGRPAGGADVGSTARLFNE